MQIRRSINSRSQQSGVIREQGPRPRGVMHVKRGPESVVSERRECVPCAEKYQQGNQHRVAHVDRPGRADKNAIELKTPDAREGRERRPGQIRPRDCAHRAIDSQHVDRPPASEREAQSNQRRNGRRPLRGSHSRNVYELFVTRAERPADHAFGGECDAIEKKCGEFDELHEH